jgi:hypothetical protein
MLISLTTSVFVRLCTLKRRKKQCQKYTLRSYLTCTYISRYRILFLTNMLKNFPGTQHMYSLNINCAGLSCLFSFFINIIFRIRSATCSLHCWTRREAKTLSRIFPKTGFVMDFLIHDHLRISPLHLISTHTHTYSRPGIIEISFFALISFTR